MFNTGRTQFNIVVRLNPGIYAFDDRAVGKTWLYKELHFDTSLSERVLAV